MNLLPLLIAPWSPLALASSPILSLSSSVAWKLWGTLKLVSFRIRRHQIAFSPERARSGRD